MEYVFNIGTLSSELVCNEANMKIWLSCLSILQVNCFLLEYRVGGATLIKLFVCYV
jgi:hypothetical protein